MANFKLTQTGEQIQADLNLLDKNSATSGQVLTANGTGGASWQNVSNVVTSVNGQTGDVTVASYSLPVANSTTLGGVKPVTKTDAMTQEVGVDTTGKLFTTPSSGSSSSFTGYNISTVGDSNPSSKSASINVMRYNNTYYSYSTSTLGDSVEGAYAIWWYGDYDTNYPQKFTGTLIDSTDGSQVTGSNTNINTLTAKRMYYVASDLVIDTSN